tara:strand:+ start:529 stop:1140 length:612 start_codon:yes stop_codon:yes gene_type:complete
MAFWTAVSDGSKDPKRTYRFVLQIANLGGGTGSDQSVIWFAKKIDKPTFSLSESEHKYLMHSYYFPGKLTWNEITATVVDPSDPDVITTLAGAFEASGYQVPGVPAAPSTSPNIHLETVGKSKSVGALGVVNIFQLDADGQVVEHWKLNQAWIKEVKASALDYDSEDLSTIDIVIRYDWAQLGAAGSVLGDVNDGLFAKNAPT